MLASAAERYALIWSRSHLLTSLLVCCLGLVGCEKTTTPEEASTDPCGDFELDVKKVWNDDVRVELGAKILEHGGDAEIEVRRAKVRSVETTMDAFSRDWVMLKRSACLDHFKRDMLTKEQYQSRSQCFDSLLTRQRTLVQAMMGDPSLGADALEEINRETTRCASL